jgi:antitoxin (DNA-binding transcriptional repressor) of toxin-antitoxin stability system
VFRIFGATVLPLFSAVAGLRSGLGLIAILTHGVSVASFTPRSKGRRGSVAPVAVRATVACMSEQISQRELRNDSGRIMRALDEGRSFVVSRNGRPVGELRPLHRDRFVDARVAVDVFRGAPSIDWERMRSELDGVVDQEITPRG